MIDVIDLERLKQELQEIYQDVYRKKTADEIKRISRDLPLSFLLAAKNGENFYEQEVIYPETVEWIKKTFSMFSIVVKAHNGRFTVVLRF